MATAIPGTSNVFIERATYASKSGGGDCCCANSGTAMMNSVIASIHWRSRRGFIFEDSPEKIAQSVQQMALLDGRE